MLLPVEFGALSITFSNSGRKLKELMKKNSRQKWRAMQD